MRSSGGLLETLGVDEAVEPRDVVLGRLGAVLDERAGVVVEAAPGGASLIVGETAGQLRPTPLEQGEAGLGREVTCEREAQREAASVVRTGGFLRVEELFEQLAAVVGDPVDLARPLGRPTGPRSPRAKARPLAAERSRRRDRGHRAGATRLGDGDRVARLETRQGGVERAERDVGEEAELVAQPPADLVPVHLLLEQESEDGELEHVSPSGRIGSGSANA